MIFIIAVVLQRENDGVLGGLERVLVDCFNHLAERDLRCHRMSVVNNRSALVVPTVKFDASSKDGTPNQRTVLYGWRDLMVNAAV